MAHAGYLWVLKIAAEEFHGRNWLTRFLALLLIGRPYVARVILCLLYVWLRAARALGLDRLSYALCSVVFNLRYYQGLSAALSGRATFIALLRSRDAANTLSELNANRESTKVI